MIAVVGSMNLDVVAMTDRYPASGETKFGQQMTMLPGGKGANQAVACAKLGKDTALIGCVGKDDIGDLLMRSLDASQVNTLSVVRTDRYPSGAALITIDESGENTMLVVKGANEALEPRHIEDRIGILQKCGILLMQMEIPKKTILYTLRKARESGLFVILDPAPMEGIAMEMLPFADVIIPNRQETGYLTGIDPTDEASAAAAAVKLAGLGVHRSVVKMGAKGAFLYDNGYTSYVPGIPVQAIDTVGAGDCFAAALACALDNGRSLKQAVEFAAVAAAISVTRLGAQSGAPTTDEIRVFCQERNLTGAWAEA